MLEKCFFCSVAADQVIIDHPLACVIADKFPVTSYHSLIIPKRHFDNFFDITKEELLEINQLLILRKEQILEIDKTVVGFNIGINVGEAAGQSVWHMHVHLIPRRVGDIENPKGGVRGVLPEKRDYGVVSKPTKLIRDNIPALMRAQNKCAEIEVVKNDTEYFLALQKKLLEEVHEFIAASDSVHAQEEIADILEVIDAICSFRNYDISVIQKIKAKKYQERGGFQKRLLLKI